MEDQPQGRFDVRKALIVPMNAAREIFIQDRRGHKKPDWGYFGGGIEGDETPTEAVIRETSEELSIRITAQDLIYLGATTGARENKKIIRYMYLYQTETKEFDVREGRGGYWMNISDIRTLLEDYDMFDKVVLRIQEVLAARTNQS